MTEFFSLNKLSTDGMEWNHLFNNFMYFALKAATEDYQVE